MPHRIPGDDNLAFIFIFLLRKSDEWLWKRRSPSSLLTDRMSLRQKTLTVEGRRNIGAGNFSKIEFEFGTFPCVAVTLRIGGNNFLERKRRVLFCVILF